MQTDNPGLWISISAALMAISIISGAFGAHLLKASLDVSMLNVYNKANFYMFINSLGLLVIQSLPSSCFSRPQRNVISKIMFLGLILFSGSLFSLVLSGITRFALFTPVGGTLLIVAWILMAYSSYKAK
ncbi:MAG: DUF423 domain-containing protein [Candidatus Dadabacteria bacterium]|nr:MAG: DUF423 domain-containing protein [Candidatus Dadabacteria bacterium]